MAPLHGNVYKNLDRLLHETWTVERKPKVADPVTAALRRDDLMPTDTAALSFAGCKQDLYTNSVKSGVRFIIPYLEDRGKPNLGIYFDGWDGIGASAVLKSIAEGPPSSLRQKVDNIIHVDCSRWKNRRTLQRNIAQQLGFLFERKEEGHSKYVMDIFDRQDENDDFCGLDEGSRVEIRGVSQEIHNALEGQSCLIVFHNGSDSMVDLNDFGIPRAAADKWSKIIQKVLWSFRGRFRAIRIKNLVDEQVGTEHYFFRSLCASSSWADILHEEAADIAQCIHKLGITLDPKIVALCCRYLLSLNSKGDGLLDFNWAHHASNYWVCDGIIEECQQDKAWKIAAVLHEEIRQECYTPCRSSNFGDSIRWIVATNSDNGEILPTIQPETTSFFLDLRKGHEHPLATIMLPDNIFQRSNKLRVLKLWCCIFNFASPPFLHCRNLRFLGLDSCKDQPQKLEEEKEEENGTTELFQSLQVLDISCTDWELTLSPSIMDKIGKHIREINIKGGRIWSKNFAWKSLENIHKLRVIDPTCPWETGSMDEFRNMVKLEFLDLSLNITMQVLPSLSDATELKTLVLDGCVALEQVDPEALPPSLETFSFDAGARKDQGNEAKIYRISLAGCSRLVNFNLRGPILYLEELDLSKTSVKALDLRDEVLQVPFLQRVILLGCERLRSVLWPEMGMTKLRILCIDTREGGEEVVKASHDSFRHEEEDCCLASVAVTDLRFLQSLVLRSRKKFVWNTDRLKLNIFLSYDSKDDEQKSSKDTIGPYSSGPKVESTLHKSLFPKIYSGVNFDKATINQDGISVWQFQPLDVHVEIGKGSNINVDTVQAVRSVIFLMNRVESLLLHNNSSITTIIPETMMSLSGVEKLCWDNLKWCCVYRCPKLDFVFVADIFPQLEIFWAADLLMTRCIWTLSPKIFYHWESTFSFAKLRAIYLHFCPRLRFVLTLFTKMQLRSLEILHVTYCGDLEHIFPLRMQFEWLLRTTPVTYVFPNLKHIYLHELPMLRQICEFKVFAPKLETITVRGCWSLKRIPAPVINRRHGLPARPIVDCEKDWWEKLEWDGMKARHHPSLFELRHSKYYKKTMPRSSALR